MSDSVRPHRRQPKYVKVQYNTQQRITHPHLFVFLYCLLFLPPSSLPPLFLMHTSTDHCHILKSIKANTYMLPAAATKSLQSCLPLCDPMDCSPPGSPIPGILQARTLEWVAISFSNVWKWKVKVKSLSCVRLSATPWTAAFQAPPSMGFSRQEYWCGVPLPSPYMLPPLTKT